MSQELENAIEGINAKAEQINANEVELKSAKEQLEAAKVEVKSTKDELVKLGTEVAKMKEANVQAKAAKEVSTAEELKDNMVEIKALAKGTSAKDVHIKASTLRSSITNNTESFRLMDIAKLAHTKLSMYDVFAKIPVNGTNNNGVITYTDWDEATTVRAAAMIAEGGTFPESTATFIEKSIPLRKVGDTLPVSEEFYEDEARFAAELGMFLQTNIDLKVDDQICNGDGSNQSLKGLISSSTAFSSTGLSTVPNATFYDLLAITPEMNIGFGSKYSFDVVFMNKKEINKLRLNKDSNNNYIIPPFVSANGSQVDGMVVLESNVMPDNQAVLGDRRYGKIYEKAGLTMAKAPVGTQFVEDLETIKVRKRLAFLVRESEARAFIHIGDVAAAIQAITTV